jgi:micrococcal nuclease
MTMRMLIVPVVGALALIMGAAGGCGTAAVTSEPAAAAAEAVELRVINIVDGDTVDLSDQRRVRLLGIDAPERGECGFEQASEFARATLLNQQVDVVPDPTQDGIDAYGRSLLYIDISGRDYSRAVTGAGWAEHYIDNNPVQKAPEIEAAEESARQQSLGIWGIAGCMAPTPNPTPTPTPTTEQASPSPAQTDDDDNVRRPAPVAPAVAPERDPEPAPPPAPAPPPKEEPEPESVYFKNCTAARAAGAAPVHRGDPGYGSHLDRDDDGVGCE